MFWRSLKELQRFICSFFKSWKWFKSHFANFKWAVTKHLLNSVRLTTTAWMNCRPNAAPPDVSPPLHPHSPDTLRTELAIKKATVIVLFLILFHIFSSFWLRYIFLQNWWHEWRLIVILVPLTFSNVWSVQVGKGNMKDDCKKTKKKSVYVEC